MKYFLILFFVLSTSVFAEVINPDHVNGCTARLGYDAGNSSGPQGYDNKEVCDAHTDCMISLSQSMCFGCDKGPNQCNGCIYNSIYTGKGCGSTGRLPPVPDPVINYCDTSTMKVDVQKLRTKCDDDKGRFKWECDRDTEKLRSACDPLDDKNPTDITGTYWTPYTHYENCNFDKGNTDAHCLYDIFAQQDSIGRNLFKQSAVNQVKSDINFTKLLNTQYSIQSDTQLMRENSAIENELLKKIVINTMPNTKVVDYLKNDFQPILLKALSDNTNKSLDVITALSPNHDLRSISRHTSSSDTHLSNIEQNQINQFSDLSDKLSGIRRDLQDSQGSDALTKHQFDSSMQKLIHDSDVKGHVFKDYIGTQEGKLNQSYKQIEGILTDKNNSLSGHSFINPLDTVFQKRQDSVCPEFEITMFGQTAVIKDHCRALEVLNKFMVVVMWAWCGIALFNDAKNIYLRVTTN